MSDTVRRDAFRLAYETLRQEIASVARGAGDQILVGPVAGGLGISPTPVREALARLAGERLVEDRRRMGYFVPLPGAWDIVELMTLSELYLLSALREARRNQGSGVRLAKPKEAVSCPFERLLWLSGNSRLLGAGLVLRDQTAPIRTALAQLNGAGRPEALAWIAESGADRAAIASAIRLHHAEVRGKAEQIARILANAHRARNSSNIV